jgi:hypothetical protein
VRRCGLSHSAEELIAFSIRNIHPYQAGHNNRWCRNARLPIVTLCRLFLGTITSHCAILEETVESYAEGNHDGRPRSLCTFAPLHWEELL